MHIIGYNICFPYLQVIFVNEEAIDEGGVRKVGYCLKGLYVLIGGFSCWYLMNFLQSKIIAISRLLVSLKKESTVNQLSFAYKKFSWGLWKPHCWEYFSPRTSICHIVEIKKQVWIRLGRKNWSAWTSLSQVNHKIKLLWIIVGSQSTST